MARKPGIHFTGAVYHVMLRGNCAQTIFLGRKDYSISDARKAYRRFVISGLDEKYHEAFHSGNQGGVALVTRNL